MVSMRGDKIYYKSGYEYQLCRDYATSVLVLPARPIVTEWISLSTAGRMIIRKGYAWDGASGGIDTKNSMRGSLVHDALYQLIRLGLLPESEKDNADHILRKICREDGMDPLRASVWKKAVEYFGKPAAKYGSERPVLVAP